MASEIASGEVDLLRRFAEASFRESEGDRGAVNAMETENRGSGTVELSLSLGLGLGLSGCFGVENKKKSEGLVRSSSMASFPVLGVEHNFLAVALPAAAPLGRACSLPVEAGSLQMDADEVRKRKEMQSLKRQEAKRKRYEKQRRLTSMDDGFLVEEFEDRRTATITGKIKMENNGGNGQISQARSPLTDHHHLIKQEDNTAPHVQSSSDTGNTKLSPPRLPPVIRRSKPVSDEPPKKVKGRANAAREAERNPKEAERNAMEEMLCVSTKADGPDGKKVEGFLYKYKKGEEVRIVCVCHGSFLSPAEFVRHAGGGEVDHPLRHIVVYPSPSSFSL